MAQAAETLLIDADLGLDQAAPLRDLLLGRRGGPLTLDVSQVDRLSALCLQVLTSARRTWAAEGHPLYFAAPSPAFTAAVSLMGAGEWTPAPKEEALP